MTRAVPVPLARIIRHLPPAEGAAWVSPAHQGPGGLFAVRCTRGEHDGPPMFQVSHLTKSDRFAYDVSAPFLTQEGAARFAEGMASGGSPDD